MLAESTNTVLGYLVGLSGGRVLPDVLEAELASRQFPQAVPGLPKPDAALQEALERVKAKFFARQRVEVRKHNKIHGIYKLDNTDEKIPGFKNDSIMCSFQNGTLVVENADSEVESSILVEYQTCATTINSVRIHQLFTRIVEDLGGQRVSFGQFVREDSMVRFESFVEALKRAAVSNKDEVRVAKMKLFREEDTIATLTTDLQTRALEELQKIHDEVQDGKMTPLKLGNRISALQDLEGRMAYYENLLATAWTDAREKLMIVSNAISAAQSYEL